MRKVIYILMILMLVMVVPQASALEGEPVHEQVILQLYGESMPEMELLDSDAADTVASLELQQEMDAEIQYTFAGGQMLTGIAQPEDRVIAAVYTISEKGRPIIWYHQDTVIGASGIYQEEIPLQLLGEQNLLVAVYNEEELQGRIYTMFRKSDAIRTELLEYELNLYEEYGLS